MGKNVDAAETSHHNFMEKAIPAFSTLMKHAQRGAEEMALEYLIDFDLGYEKESESKKLLSLGLHKRVLVYQSAINALLEDKLLTEDQKQKYTNLISPEQKT